MPDTLTLVLIQRKKLFYDIGYFGFKFIHASISSSTILICDYFNLGTIPTMIFFLAFFFGTGYLIFNNMYGSWLVNYKVKGSLLLDEERIIVKSEDNIQTYTIKNFAKIILKQNYYQNYTKYLGPIYDGISSITIDLGMEKKVKLEYLVRNSEELESLNSLYEIWKQNGLSIWK